VIYPKNHPVISNIFRLYAGWITRWYFHELNFNTIPIDTNKPVLLIANHFSSWDGLVLYEVNRQLFKKRFHVMLLESTSKKIPMLKYGGGFSVHKQSKDMITSLHFAAGLLADPDNLVLMFPQGKLYSNLVNEVHFEKGILKIIEKAGGDFQLVFAATFIENFQYKKPIATVYLKAVNDNNFADINALQQAYQQHYSAARLQQTQITV
jgi:1-acyl-sn-glycerol-3-phosphate acyltransferase